MLTIKKLWHKIFHCCGRRGYEGRITITIGYNAHNSIERKEKMNEIGEEFSAKFASYLDQYPHKISWTK